MRATAFCRAGLSGVSIVAAAALTMAARLRAALASYKLSDGAVSVSNRCITPANDGAHQQMRANSPQYLGK